MPCRNVVALLIFEMFCINIESRPDSRTFIKCGKVRRMNVKTSFERVIRGP